MKPVDFIYENSKYAEIWSKPRYMELQQGHPSCVDWSLVPSEVFRKTMEEHRNLQDPRDVEGVTVEDFFKGSYQMMVSKFPTLQWHGGGHPKHDQDLRAVDWGIGFEVLFVSEDLKKEFERAGKYNFSPAIEFNDPGISYPYLHLSLQLHDGFSGSGSSINLVPSSTSQPHLRLHKSESFDLPPIEYELDASKKLNFCRHPVEGIFSYDQCRKKLRETGKYCKPYDPDGRYLSKGSVLWEFDEKKVLIPAKDPVGKIEKSIDDLLAAFPEAREILTSSPD